MTTGEFAALLDRLAQALAARDHAAAADCFAADVRYRDAMRTSLDGRAQLLEMFDTEIVAPGVVWHNVVFDETKQMGAVEYTSRGLHRFHGVAIARVDGAVITEWRALQHLSDFEWSEFWGGAESGA